MNCLCSSMAVGVLGVVLVLAFQAPTGPTVSTTIDNSDTVAKVSVIDIPDTVILVPGDNFAVNDLADKELLGSDNVFSGSDSSIINEGVVSGSPNPAAVSEISHTHINQVPNPDALVAGKSKLRADTIISGNKFASLATLDNDRVNK